MAQDDAEAREARRRVMEAAHTLYFTPGYRGHWVGAMLFGATMVGAAMLYTFLPTAMALLGGASAGGGSAATFIGLYAAMAVLPIGGWALWGLRRRWAAVAVSALFGVCVVWLNSAAAV